MQFCISPHFLQCEKSCPVFNYFVSSLSSFSDSTYYVVLFNLREKPDTVDDDISNTIASEKSRTYLDGISEGYTLSDPKDHLNLKALESADKDDESGDDSKEDGSTPEDGNTDKTNPEDEGG